MSTSQRTRSFVQRLVEQDLLAPETLLSAEEQVAPTGYELVRCLGQGGGGTVYLARHVELGRDVAVKFLHHAGPADLERFRREARITARLNNPAIVQVYELGEAEGQPYIAMQYIDGGNLAEAELDDAAVVRIGRDVARALHYAHVEGIVHRDIKPENILLDGSERAYVTDFGIARSLCGELGETISRHGQIMGTPALMPPEQARGDIESIDARSDVYALGATLFQKLTGSYPFEASHVVDVLHAVIHDPPPLPRSLRGTIPRSVEAVLLKCLQKNRDARYQTMEELEQEIDSLLEGGRIRAESAVWFRTLVSRRAGVEPVAPEPEPDPDPYWTTGLDIVRRISAWDTDLYRVSGSLERSFGRLDAIRAELDRILAERPDTAWARFYRGVVSLRAGDLAAARDDMERVIDRVNNLAGAYFELGKLYLALYLQEDHEARKHMSKVGVSHDLTSARGRLDQAVLAFQEAERLQGELPPWHAEYAQAVARLSESDFAGCVEQCDAILDREPDLEEVWKLRGDALRLADKDPFESYERALQVRRSYYEALYAMAEAHMARGQLDEARQSLQRACEINPRFAAATAMLARICLRQARRTGCEDAIACGLEIAEQALAVNPQSYDAAMTIAELHLERGRRQSEPEPLEECLAMIERSRMLPGCQNRVEFVRAQTLLERARQRAARGEDPRRDLDTVCELADGAAADVPDNHPWVEIRRQAEAVGRRIKK
jgi:serine/threonine protein kinase